MGEHTLLLHVGIPKTGTSALQKFLYQNMNQLKAYGWSYPDLRTAIGGIESYYLDYMNATVLYKEENVLDTNSENWICAWNFLRNELENYNIILSSEMMFTWGTIEEFLNKVKKEYHNIKIIVYLRRQDLFLESYWAQLVKTDNHVKGFEESKKEFEKYLHYIDLLDLMSKSIGKENLIVRVYEKEQYKGNRKDLFSDFFDAIGVNPDWTDFCEVGMINESLYGNYLEIRRVFNTLQELDNNLSKEYYRYFFKLSSQLSKEERVLGCFKNEKERRAFLDKFKEENKVIAEQYMHNKDGVLFNDMNTDIPFLGVKASAFEEDLIRLFVTIVHTEVRRLKNRVNFLEKKSHWFIENMVTTQKKGRKIAYFGGGQKCSELLNKYNWDVEIIIDNDEKKSGDQIDGIYVVNPLDINNWRELFIIITCMNTKDIEDQLIARGLQKNIDYVLACEFLYG